MTQPLADFLFECRNVLQDAWLHEAPGSGDVFARVLDAVAARMANPGAQVSEEFAREAALLLRGPDGRPVVAGYRRLRQTVLRLWRERSGADAEPAEEEGFHAAVDAVEEAALEAYVQGRLVSEREAVEASAGQEGSDEPGPRHWEDIFLHLGVGVGVMGPEDTTLVSTNPALARMHGQPAESLKGLRLEDLVAPESRGALPRHMAAVGSKLSHEYEALHLRRDGSRFPAFVHVTSLRDATGRRVGRAATVLDITGRRQAEAERQRLLATIEAERSRLSAVLDQLPAGVLIAEAPSGRLLLGNRALESLLGHPFRPASSVADYDAAHQMFSADSQLLPEDAWPMARALRTGETRTAEPFQVRRPDGTTAHLLGSSAPVRDLSGNIVAGVVTLVDVTERRRAEETAREAALFGERFIAIVSHDLRNPLNAIQLSATKLLHGDALPERDRKAVSRIARSGERMARMISELLDFTRGRLGGGIPIDRVPGDLRAVVRQAVDELEAAWPERSLTFQPSPGFYEGAWDADRLLQVVSNLGGNALQYSPPDSPVRFTLTDLGEQVSLEVHNSGTPIPPDVLPHLFDPFRRGGGSNPHGGLGLGLYIVEQVVKGHGGRIEVRSRAAEGTVFRVLLPRGALIGGG
ncbi:PAS domain S-box protein [Corallococcus sp. bb12-1]|uniref:PAS domain-containing sensor histidine kinase n=1 Tax=Corallococcus sp. bb12-1 TaxID=2996784 RepID=UPI00226F2904|nr:PAS domain-containing sensor histidine kinase [Corallococcus sp. bb12-1]MCY1046647.1 PAS domain S-box protein [Corallococcus sp. bb12-1]